MKCINKNCNTKLVRGENKYFQQWGIKFYKQIFKCPLCEKEYIGSVYRYDS